MQLYGKAEHRKHAVNSRDMALTVKQIRVAAQAAAYALLDYFDAGRFRDDFLYRLPAGEPKQQGFLRRSEGRDSRTGRQSKDSRRVLAFVGATENRRTLLCLQD
jgi:hypothetical protein